MEQSKNHTAKSNRYTCCRINFSSLKMLKKIITSIKYFLFLATNWNLKIAWVLTTTDKKGDEKYHINTTGYDKLKHLTKADIDISHSTMYMAAPYIMLDLFFEKVNLTKSRHFLDIGSGKGRALFVAAARGAQKVTGVELSSKLLGLARKNIVHFSEIYPGKNISLKHDDAWYFEIEKDVDIIFLFNPFDEILMQQVADNIDQSLEENPRKIQVIYFNPLHKHVFLNQGWEKKYHWQKLVYMEGIILEKESKSKVKIKKI